MGRQPFGVASAAAWLRRVGWEVTCADLAKQPLPAASVSSAHLLAFHLPMHTATRLAGPVIARVRALNPGARLCAFGLYAPLNETWLRSLGLDAIFGGEFEEALASFAGDPSSDQKVDRRVGRVRFLVPDRSTLPPLTSYATLQLPDGSCHTAGYTEASRGCKHLCRHCPIVPIYGGQFRIVPLEIVLADIDAQIRAAPRHITFGDPDFFNGPTHAIRVIEGVHRAHPGISTT